MEDSVAYLAKRGMESGHRGDRLSTLMQKDQREYWGFYMASTCKYMPSMQKDQV